MNEWMNEYYLEVLTKELQYKWWLIQKHIVREPVKQISLKVDSQDQYGNLNIK